MTEEPLTAARAAIAAGPGGPCGDAWPILAALLLRRAIEKHVEEQLRGFPGAKTASIEGRLAVLVGLRRPDAAELAMTWKWLGEVIRSGDSPPERLFDASCIVERCGRSSGPP